MTKRRELTGNRKIVKGNPERERVIREERRKVDALMREVSEPRRELKPFRGTISTGMEF